MILYIAYGIRTPSPPNTMIRMVSGGLIPHGSVGHASIGLGCVVLGQGANQGLGFKVSGANP